MDCIVDDTGKIVREVKVASEPEVLLQVLRASAYPFKRIGLEAGPLSQWLFSALAEAGLPVICVETRHMRAVLKAQINKTDRNDARGIAQMMRVGLYRPVHVKTLRSQMLRMLLTHRKLLQSKAIAVENDLRATLRNFGLKVGIVGTAKYEIRIKELVENFPDLMLLVDPLLVVRRVLREQINILHRRVLAVVRDDEVCQRLMTVPGVGPVVALTYRATVDVPARFRKSKSVGAVFGLTCSRDQSGERDRPGAISRCGDEMMRAMLYEAAQAMLLRSAKWSWLKAWAMQIARRRGMKRAIVALARRLAVIMHRIYGPAARCKGIRTEWSFWSALIYPASRRSSCNLHALRLIRDRLAIRPAGRRYASAKIDDLLLRNIDLEGPNCVVVGRQNKVRWQNAQDTRGC
jgi:transposase